jgi:hypothetical protein
MGMACSTNGEKRNVLVYWWESQIERDYLEEQGTGG